MLSLGNMNSLRDWGHARDYVYMQWLMLQQEAPEDFVIATGRQISFFGPPLLNSELPCVLKEKEWKKKVL